MPTHGSAVVRRWYLSLLASALLFACGGTSLSKRPISRTAVHSEAEPEAETPTGSSVSGERRRLYVASFLLELEQATPKVLALAAKSAEFRSSRTSRKLPLSFVFERIAKRNAEGEGHTRRFDLSRLRVDYAAPSSAPYQAESFSVPYRVYSAGGRSKLELLKIGLGEENGALRILYLENDAGEFN